MQTKASRDSSRQLLIKAFLCCMLSAVLAPIAYGQDVRTLPGATIPSASVVKGFAKALNSPILSVQEEAAVLWADSGGWSLLETADRPKVVARLLDFAKSTTLGAPGLLTHLQP
jgi:hypothetical protein